MRAAVSGGQPRAISPTCLLEVGLGVVRHQRGACGVEAEAGELDPLGLFHGTPTIDPRPGPSMGHPGAGQRGHGICHTRGVILLYPLLLIVAAVIVWRTRARRGAGWSGFVAWCLAGASFTFSLLTGFSIGLFLLPLVVLAIYLAIRLAPGFRATLGFIGGIGAILLVIASIHNAAMDWLIPGVALSGVALASFATLLGIDRHRTRRAVGPLRPE
jgi:hypothetical protein